MSAARFSTLRLSLAMAVTIGLAACSTAASPSPSGTPARSPSQVAGAAVLLRVTSEGGFINPASTLLRCRP